MSDPIAFVTGGASGIGLAATRRLVERGYRVAVIDVVQPNLDAVSQELGPKVIPLRVDVSDRQALHEAVAQVEKIGPIEHVLGCAGIARVGATLSVTEADVELMTRVNYLGVVNLVDAVLPPMLARNHGELAVIASGTGLVAPRKMAAYGATKAAVVGYLTSLSYELKGTGITLGIVCPAAVATPMATDFFADPDRRAKSMAVTPESIVKAIEKGLRRRKLIIAPGLAGSAYLLQRISPSAMRAVGGSRFADLVS